MISDFQQLLPTTIDNNDYLYLSTCTINTLIKYTFDHIFIYNILCTDPLLDYTFLSSSHWPSRHDDDGSLDYKMKSTESPSHLS